jgi:chromosome segregation ATPase
LAQIESRQAEVEREMAALSKPFSEQEAQVRQTRVSLEERRSQLNEKIKSLEIRKSDTFKMIEMANANMAKWNREMALNQTKIVELDMQVMEYERLALNIRSQIVEAQTRLTESRIERKKAEDESQLFKAALLKTQNELKQIQTEQQRAENEKRNAQLALNRDRNHYEVEMKKIESKIVIAKTAQSLAEGESKRIAAETESMRSRLLEMQAQGETADVNLAGAQTSLMQTRISLQQVRADLVRQLGTEEKSTLKNNSYAQQVRSLASMANTSELSEGVRPWVLKRVCTIRRQPAYSADKLGEAKTGDRIYASPDLDSGWVKILNASGSTAFIRSSCGQFQE